jgi:transcriptional regulator with XRE-family HTH domain
MRKRSDGARLPWSPEIETRAKLLGPALRMLRQRKRRTQLALCKEVRVTKGMLSSYETGRQLPSLGSLLTVLAGLECDFGDLQEAMDYLAGKPPRPGSSGEQASEAQAEREVGGAIIMLVRHLGLQLPFGLQAIALPPTRVEGRKRGG